MDKHLGNLLRFSLGVFSAILLAPALSAALEIGDLETLSNMPQNSYEVPWWNASLYYRVPLAFTVPSGGPNNRSGEIVTINGTRLEQRLPASMLDSVYENSLRVVYWNGSENILVPSQVDDWWASPEKHRVTRPIEGDFGYECTSDQSISDPHTSQQSKTSLELNVSLGAYSVYVNTTTGGTYSLNITKCYWDTTNWVCTIDYYYADNITIGPGRQLLRRVEYPLKGMYKVNVKGEYAGYNLSCFDLVRPYLDDNQIFDSRVVSLPSDVVSSGDELVFSLDFLYDRWDEYNVLTNGTYQFFVYFNTSSVPEKKKYPVFFKTTHYFSPPVLPLEGSWVRWGNEYTDIDTVCYGAEILNTGFPKPEVTGKIFLDKTRFFVSQARKPANASFEIRRRYNGAVLAASNVSFPAGDAYWMEVDFSSDDLPELVNVSQNASGYDFYACLNFTEGYADLGYGGNVSGIQNRTWIKNVSSGQWEDLGQDLAFVFDFTTTREFSNLYSRDSLYLYRGYAALLNFSRGATIQSLWSPGNKQMSTSQSWQLVKEGTNVSASFFDAIEGQANYTYLTDNDPSDFVGGFDSANNWLSQMFDVGSIGNNYRVDKLWVKMASLDNNTTNLRAEILEHTSGGCGEENYTTLVAGVNMNGFFNTTPGYRPFAFNQLLSDTDLHGCVYDYRIRVQVTGGTGSVEFYYDVNNNSYDFYNNTSSLLTDPGVELLGTFAFAYEGQHVHDQFGEFVHGKNFSTDAFVQAFDVQAPGFFGSGRLFLLKNISLPVNYTFWKYLYANHSYWDGVSNLNYATYNVSGIGPAQNSNTTARFSQTYDVSDFIDPTGFEEGYLGFKSLSVPLIINYSSSTDPRMTWACSLRVESVKHVGQNSSLASSSVYTFPPSPQQGLFLDDYVSLPLNGVLEVKDWESGDDVNTTLLVQAQKTSQTTWTYASLTNWSLIDTDNNVDRVTQLVDMAWYENLAGGLSTMSTKKYFTGVKIAVSGCGTEPQADAVRVSNVSDGRELAHSVGWEKDANNNYTFYFNQSVEAYDWNHTTTSVYEYAPELNVTFDPSSSTCDVYWDPDVDLDYFPASAGEAQDWNYSSTQNLIGTYDDDAHITTGVAALWANCSGGGACNSDFSATNQHAHFRQYVNFNQRGGFEIDNEGAGGAFGNESIWYVSSVTVPVVLKTAVNDTRKFYCYINASMHEAREQGTGLTYYNLTNASSSLYTLTASGTVTATFTVTLSFTSTFTAQNYHPGESFSGADVYVQLNVYGNRHGVSQTYTFIPGEWGACSLAYDSGSATEDDATDWEADGSYITDPFEGGDEYGGLEGYDLAVRYRGSWLDMPKRDYKFTYLDFSYARCSLGADVGSVGTNNWVNMSGQITQGARDIAFHYVGDERYWNKTNDAAVSNCSYELELKKYSDNSTVPFEDVSTSRTVFNASSFLQGGRLGLLSYSFKPIPLRDGYGKDYRLLVHANGTSSDNFQSYGSFSYGDDYPSAGLIQQLFLGRILGTLYQYVPVEQFGGYAANITHVDLLARFNTNEDDNPFWSGIGNGPDYNCTITVSAKDAGTNQVLEQKKIYLTELDDGAMVWRGVDFDSLVVRDKYAGDDLIIQLDVYSNDSPNGSVISNCSVYTENNAVPETTNYLFANPINDILINYSVDFSMELNWSACGLYYDDNKGADDYRLSSTSTKFGDFWINYTSDESYPFAEFALTDGDVSGSQYFAQSSAPDYYLERVHEGPVRTSVKYRFWYPYPSGTWVNATQVYTFYDDAIGSQQGLHLFRGVSGNPVQVFPPGSKTSVFSARNPFNTSLSLNATVEIDATTDYYDTDTLDGNASNDSLQAVSMTADSKNWIVVKNSSRHVFASIVSALSDNTDHLFYGEGTGKNPRKVFYDDNTSGGGFVGFGYSGTSIIVPSTFNQEMFFHDFSDFAYKNLLKNDTNYYAKYDQENVNNPVVDTFGAQHSQSFAIDLDNDYNSSKLFGYIHNMGFVLTLNGPYGAVLDTTVPSPAQIKLLPETYTHLTRHQPRPSILKYNETHNPSETATFDVYLYRISERVGEVNRVILRLGWDARNDYDPSNGDTPPEYIELPATRNPQNRFSEEETAVVYGEISFNGTFVKPVCAAYPFPNRPDYGAVEIRQTGQGSFNFTGRVWDLFQGGGYGLDPSTATNGIECMVFGTSDAEFEVKHLEFFFNGSEEPFEVYDGTNYLGAFSDNSDWQASAASNPSLVNYSFQPPAINTTISMGTLTINETAEDRTFGYGWDMYEERLGDIVFVKVQVSGYDDRTEGTFTITHWYMMNVDLPELETSFQPLLYRIDFLENLRAAEVSGDGVFVWDEKNYSGVPNKHTLTYRGWKSSLNASFREALVEAGGVRRKSIYAVPRINKTIGTYYVRDLPPNCVLTTWVGLASINKPGNPTYDSCTGGANDGVVFTVNVSNETGVVSSFSQTLSADDRNWTFLELNLSNVSNQDAYISFITSHGPSGYICDHAAWGEPQLFCGDYRYIEEVMPLRSKVYASENYTWTLFNITSNTTKNHYANWSIVEDCGSDNCEKGDFSVVGYPGYVLYPGESKEFTWYLGSEGGRYEHDLFLKTVFNGSYSNKTYLPPGGNRFYENTVQESLGEIEARFGDPWFLASSFYSNYSEKQVYKDFLSPLFLETHVNDFLYAPVYNVSNTLEFPTGFEVVPRETPHKQEPFGEFDVWRDLQRISRPYPRQDYLMLNFKWGDRGVSNLNASLYFENAVVHECFAPASSAVSYSEGNLTSLGVINSSNGKVNYTQFLDLGFLGVSGGSLGLDIVGLLVNNSFNGSGAYCEFNVTVNRTDGSTVCSDSMATGAGGVQELLFTSLGCYENLSDFKAGDDYRVLVELAAFDNVSSKANCSVLFDQTDNDTVDLDSSGQSVGQYDLSLNYYSGVLLRHGLDNVSLYSNLNNNTAEFSCLVHSRHGGKLTLELEADRDYDVFLGNTRYDVSNSTVVLPLSYYYTVENSSVLSKTLGSKDMFLEKQNLLVNGGFENLSAWTAFYSTDVGAGNFSVNLSTNESHYAGQGSSKMFLAENNDYDLSEYYPEEDKVGAYQEVVFSSNQTVTARGRAFVNCVSGQCDEGAFVVSVGLLNGSGVPLTRCFVRDDGVVEKRGVNEYFGECSGGALDYAGGWKMLYVDLEVRPKASVSSLNFSAYLLNPSENTTVFVDQAALFLNAPFEAGEEETVLFENDSVEGEAVISPAGPYDVYVSYTGGGEVEANLDGVSKNVSLPYSEKPAVARVGRFVLEGVVETFLKAVFVNQSLALEGMDFNYRLEPGGTSLFNFTYFNESAVSGSTPWINASDSDNVSFFAQFVDFADYPEFSDWGSVSVNGLALDVNYWKNNSTDLDPPPCNVSVDFYRKIKTLDTNLSSGEDLRGWYWWYVSVPNDALCTDNVPPMDGAYDWYEENYSAFNQNWNGTPGTGWIDFQNPLSFPHYNWQREGPASGARGHVFYRKKVFIPGTPRFVGYRFATDGGFALYVNGEKVDTQFGPSTDDDDVCFKSGAYSNRFHDPYELYSYADGNRGFTSFFNGSVQRTENYSQLLDLSDFSSQTSDVLWVSLPVSIVASDPSAECGFRANLSCFSQNCSLPPIVSNTIYVNNSSNSSDVKTYTITLVLMDVDSPRSYFRLKDYDQSGFDANLTITAVAYNSSGNWAACAVGNASDNNTKDFDSSGPVSYDYDVTYVYNEVSEKAPMRDITEHFRQGENTIAIWVSDNNLSYEFSDFRFNITYYENQFTTSGQHPVYNSTKLFLNFSTVSLYDWNKSGSDLVAVVRLSPGEDINSSVACSINFSNKTLKLRGINALGDWDDYVETVKEGLWLKESEGNATWQYAELGSSSRLAKINKQGEWPEFFLKTRRSDIGKINVSAGVYLYEPRNISMAFLVSDEGNESWVYKNYSLPAGESLVYQLVDFSAQNTTFGNESFEHPVGQHRLVKMKIGVLSPDHPNNTLFAVSYLRAESMETRNLFLNNSLSQDTSVYLNDFVHGEIEGNLGFWFLSSEKNISKEFLVRSTSTGFYHYNLSMEGFNRNTDWYAVKKRLEENVWVSEAPFVIRVESPASVSTYTNFTVNVSITTNAFLREKINISNLSFVRPSGVSNIDFSSESFEVGVLGKNETRVFSFNLSTKQQGNYSFMALARGVLLQSNQTVFDDSQNNTLAEAAFSVSLTRPLLQQFDVNRVVLNASLSSLYFSPAGDVEVSLDAENASFLIQESGGDFSVSENDGLAFFLWREYVSLDREVSSSDHSWKIVLHGRWKSNPDYLAPRVDRYNVSANISIFVPTGDKRANITNCSVYNSSISDNTNVSLLRVSDSKYSLFAQQNASFAGFDCEVRGVDLSPASYMRVVKFNYSVAVSYLDVVNFSINLSNKSTSAFVDRGSVEKSLEYDPVFSSSQTLSLAGLNPGDHRLFNLSLYHDRPDSALPAEAKISAEGEALGLFDNSVLMDSTNKTYNLSYILGGKIDVGEGEAPSYFGIPKSILSRPEIGIGEVFPIDVFVSAGKSIFSNVTDVNSSIYLPKGLFILDKEPHPSATDAVISGGVRSEEAFSKYDTKDDVLFTLNLWREYIYLYNDVWQIRLHVLWDGDSGNLTNVSSTEGISYSGWLNLTSMDDPNKTLIYDCHPYFSETNNTSEIYDKIPESRIYPGGSDFNISKIVSEQTYPSAHVFRYVGASSGVDYDGFYCDIVGTGDANVLFYHRMGGQEFNYQLGNGSLSKVKNVTDLLRVNYLAPNNNTKSFPLLAPDENHTFRWNVVSNLTGDFYFNASWEGYEEFFNRIHSHNISNASVKILQWYDVNLSTTLEVPDETELGTVFLANLTSFLTEDSNALLDPSRAWLNISDEFEFIEQESHPELVDSDTGDPFTMYLFREYLRKVGDDWRIRMSVVFSGHSRVDAASIPFNSTFSVGPGTSIKECYLFDGEDWQKDDVYQLSSDEYEAMLYVGNDVDGFSCVVEGDASSTFSLSARTMYEGRASFDVYMGDELKDTGVLNYSLSGNVAFPFEVSDLRELGKMYPGQLVTSRWYLYANKTGEGWVNATSQGWDSWHLKPKSDTQFQPVYVYGFLRLENISLPDRVYPDMVFNETFSVRVSENALSNVTAVSLVLDTSSNVNLTDSPQPALNDSELLDSVNWTFEEDPNLTYDGTNVTLSIHREYTWKRGSRWKQRVYFRLGYDDENITLPSKTYTSWILFLSQEADIIECAGLGDLETKDTLSDPVYNASRHAYTSVTLYSLQNKNSSGNDLFDDVDGFYCDVNGSGYSGSPSEFSVLFSTNDSARGSAPYIRVYDGRVAHADENDFTLSDVVFSYTYSNSTQVVLDLGEMSPNSSREVSLYFLSTNRSDAEINATTFGVYVKTLDQFVEKNDLSVDVVFPFEVNVSSSPESEIGMFAPLDVSVGVPNTSFDEINRTNVKLSLSSGLSYREADELNSTCSLAKIGNESVLVGEGCVVVWRDYHVKRQDRFRSWINARWKIPAFNDSKNTSVLGNLTLSNGTIEKCVAFSNESNDSFRLYSRPSNSTVKTSVVGSNVSYTVSADVDSSKINETSLCFDATDWDDGEHIIYLNDNFGMLIANLTPNCNGVDCYFCIQPNVSWVNYEGVNQIKIFTNSFNGTTTFRKVEFLFRVENLSDAHVPKPFFFFNTSANNFNTTDVVDGFACLVEGNSSMDFGFDLKPFGYLYAPPIKHMFVGETEKFSGVLDVSFSDKVTFNDTDVATHVLGRIGVNETNTTRWRIHSTSDGESQLNVSVSAIDFYTKMDYHSFVPLTPRIENFLKVEYSLLEKNLGQVFPINVTIKNSENALTRMNNTTVSLVLPSNVSLVEKIEAHNATSKLAPLTAGLTVWREYLLLKNSSGEVFRLVVHFDKKVENAYPLSNSTVVFELQNSSRAKILDCYGDAERVVVSPGSAEFSLITHSGEWVNYSCVVEGNDTGFYLTVNETGYTNSIYDYLLNFSIGSEEIGSAYNNYSIYENSLIFGAVVNDSFFVESMGVGEEASHVWYAYASDLGGKNLSVNASGVETKIGFESNTSRNVSVNVSDTLSVQMGSLLQAPSVERGHFLPFYANISFSDGSPYPGGNVSFFLDSEFLSYNSSNDSLSAENVFLRKEMLCLNGSGNYSLDHLLEMNYSGISAYGVDEVDLFGNNISNKKKYVFGQPWIYVDPTANLSVELLEAYFPSPAVKDTTIGFLLVVKNPLNQTYAAEQNGRQNYGMLYLSSPDGPEEIPFNATAQGYYLGGFFLQRDYPGENFSFSPVFEDVYGNTNEYNVWTEEFMLKDKSASVEVWLTDNNTYEPIESAGVLLTGYGGNYSVGKVTGESGFVVFKAGYDYLEGESNYTLRVSFGTYVPVELELSLPTNATVNLRLDPKKGSLHVLVVDEEGSPVKDASIWVYRSGEIVYEGLTGENGVASFYPSYPGEYLATSLSRNTSSGSAKKQVAGDALLRVEVVNLAPENLVISGLDGEVYGEDNPLVAGKPYALLVSAYANFSGKLKPVSEKLRIRVSEKVSVNMFSPPGQAENSFIVETNEHGEAVVSIMPTTESNGNNVVFEILEAAETGFVFENTSVSIPVSEASLPSGGAVLPYYDESGMMSRYSDILVSVINALEWLSNCEEC